MSASYVKLSAIYANKKSVREVVKGIIFFSASTKKALLTLETYKLHENKC